MTRYDELLKEGQAVYRTRVPDRKALAPHARRPMTDAQRRRYHELLEEGRAVYRTAKPERKPDYPRWVLDRYALCEACEATAQTDEVRDCAKTATAKPCSQRRRIFEGWGCAAGHWKKGDPGGSSTSSVITDRNAPEARNTGNTVPDQGRVLILDWGGGPILDNIAKGLAALGYSVTRHPRSGGKRLTPQILATIKELSPTLCVTRQRFYRGQLEIPKALKRIGCETLFVDLGVWPHYDSYIVDPLGENATSSIVGRLDELEAHPATRAAADGALPQVEAMRQSLLHRALEAQSRLDELGLSDLGDWRLSIPFLVVLQRGGDQVLRFDAPSYFADPVQVAKEAIVQAETTGVNVVIKPHPMDRDDVLKAIPSSGPNHRVVPNLKAGVDNDRQFAWLLFHAWMVLLVNSTCHFQALALGKDVACLGRGWFSGNNVVKECKHGGIIEAIDAEGRGSYSRVEPRRYPRYLAHLMSRQARVADFANPATLRRLLALALLDTKSSEPLRA